MTDQVREWRPIWTVAEEEEISSAVEQLRLTMSALEVLRSKLKLSQKEMAEILGVTQSNVSKMEKSSEQRLSVLRKVIEHQGGELHLIAKFGDEQVVLPLPAMAT